MYLSYAEYQNMGGVLTETAFNAYEFEAESFIDWYTFNRLHAENTIPEKVKQCVFYIIRKLEQQAAVMNGGSAGSTDSGAAGITSQSNDGVSVSYNVLSASEIYKSSKTDIEAAVKRYLQGVTNSLGRELLYKGLYKGE